MRIAWEGRELYCHISTKAGFDPVKTLYVCAPGADAASYEAAARFAQASGWREIAEQDGAVLVLPIVPYGWRAEDAGLLMEIYRGTRGSFPTQSGKSLYGRGGYLWCWETLIYAVGYEDGASFLGDASAACPSFFAAAALVGGVPQDYTPGERPSSHWLVENVSADYKTLNRELPVCLWLMVRERQEADAAVRYFNRSNGAQGPGCEEMFDDISATVYRAPDGGAAQVRISTGTFGPEPALARTVFSQLFERVIRWKNGPDGKLTPFMSRADFYASPRFALDSVVYGGRSYGFFVHVPEGLTAGPAAGVQRTWPGRTGLDVRGEKRLGQAGGRDRRVSAGRAGLSGKHLVSGTRRRCIRPDDRQAPQPLRHRPGARLSDGLFQRRHDDTGGGHAVSAAFRGFITLECTACRDLARLCGRRVADAVLHLSG